MVLGRLNMNDGFGGGTLIDRNLFFGSLLESTDHGPYNSWYRFPFLTDVKNGTPSIDMLYNHLDSNLFLKAPGNAVDTDNGSAFLNGTSNVMYLAGLWKADFGGHSKSYSKNVVIYGEDHKGGNCGPGTGTPKWEKHAQPDYFIGNDCIGVPSKVKDCSAAASASTKKLVIRDNRYYLPGGKGSPVCSNTSSPLEQGSKVLPYPDNAGIIKLAKTTLGMSTTLNKLTHSISRSTGIEFVI